MEEPGGVRLMDGALHVDDRGVLSTVNGFDFGGVKRFYVIKNHQPGFVRAWHAHRSEAKYVFAAQGAALVGAVRIDNWDRPSKDLEVERVILTAEKPAVLYIPAGYANGTMSLTEDASLIFFSTSALEDSLDDDIRYDSRYWDIWKVEER